MSDPNLPDGVTQRDIDTVGEPMMAEEMPEILGINKRYYPSSYTNQDICTITVLVEGDRGDYAAYTANSGDEVFAARHGDKIRFEEACVHFRGLVKEKYRD